LATDHERLQSALDVCTAADTPDPAAAAALLTAVEDAIADENLAATDHRFWLRYLDQTRLPGFLNALGDRSLRYRWADTTFALIEHTGYGLADLLDQRCDRHGDRTLLRESGEPGAACWSYSQVRRRIREIAAVLLGDRPDPELPPRVAIFAENSVGTACTDLACLLHDILVTPLSVHFNTETILWICDRLQITTVVTDDAQRVAQLTEVRAQAEVPFAILLLEAHAGDEHREVRLLDERCAKLTAAEVDRRLARRPRLECRDVCTVMFTSGSTGRPKGVAFNAYNLVTKRFARAAALPDVGQNEIQLCYLPLYHTFGRFLELQGALFWGGTYVFAANPSADTLLRLFRQVRPTGLISIPLRWVQIQERYDALLAEQGDRSPAETFAAVVGDRLRWGLSAAGYLDPKVFRFFHRMGVQLCSGFGMTEGTGGLTMTPPDAYIEGSVGIPLPGVHTRFSAQGELSIAGPYVARYLPEEAPTGDLTVAEPASDRHWIATGDLFVEHAGGQLEIVDRIKDIYKNNRGQTIAPRKVEAQFTGVPGIERTFLVGDARNYNTLLIVPDRGDEVLESCLTDEEEHEYFQRIVTEANLNLAPYERVVNFVVLERDFAQDRDELTPKGSYRRKQIATNFADSIDELYRSNVHELDWEGLRVLIPRWFFRDLGILEGAIQTDESGLVDTGGWSRLTLRLNRARDRLLVGDLEYRLSGDTLDLGLFARQPLLWVGNPSLTAFGPCKAGWDTPLATVAEQVWLPDRSEGEIRALTAHVPPVPELAVIDTLCQQALFGPHEAALNAVATLAQHLRKTGDRTGDLIRRRLEALANHPEADVRSSAYRVLVFDEPVPDYHRFLPAFIESNRTFLDQESIATIAQSAIEPRRLQAFRQRLDSYRSQLTWPADAARRQVFDDLLRLLADFARYQPAYYAPVREELVSWALHDQDPDLAHQAEQYFHELAAWFEQELASRNTGNDPQAWASKISYQEGMAEGEITKLNEVLVGTTFLDESVMLACEGDQLSPAEIEPGGIWISRILSHPDYRRYRVSINTRAGKHYDLQLIMRQDLDQEHVLETIFWLIAIRGYPHGTPVFPAFGCCRPELGATSLAYVSDLTVWERIREFSSVRGPGTRLPSASSWRHLFVAAMATVLRGWHHSGRRIIPGMVAPANIVVPEPDFRGGGTLNSISGWQRYDGPLSLMRPLVKNFYAHTVSHYPWVQEHLQLTWIFDACVEALGIDSAREFLVELGTELRDGGDAGLDPELPAAAAAYLTELDRQYHVPLPLRSALARYHEWQRVNPQATAAARLEILGELKRLYRLDQYHEIARYYLFRHTYFQDATRSVHDAFDRLLHKLLRQRDKRATQLVDLSDLQAALVSPEDRLAFRRLAFPRARGAADVEVMTVGDRELSHIIVRSQIVDRQGVSYSVYEPTGPSEVGQVYRQFLLEGFPKTISERDRYLVVTNDREQIVGGVCYQLLDDGVVHLDGTAVTRTLHGRGITSALLEDFCTRMSDAGQRVIKTHFFLRGFYLRHGFQVDRRWGGLVRFL
jgi:long-subunit acyl-CoA synthetase (AMP-forming)/predicted GNAT family acetyltransferase